MCLGGREPWAPEAAGDTAGIISEELRQQQGRGMNMSTLSFECIYNLIYIFIDYIFSSSWCVFTISFFSGKND